MKTRRFIVYSVIYIVLLGILVYSIDSSDHTFGLLGYSFTMPLALWVILPVAFFAILCIAHIAYHGFEIYMFKRSIKRDETLYKELAREVLLGLDTNKDFKTELYKAPSQITKILSPWGKHKDEAISDDELESVAKTVKNVINGEVVDLKKFRLQSTNLLFIQNELNKIEKNSTYFLDVLKDYKEINDEISKKANEKLITTGNFADIKKFNFAKSAEETMTLLERFVKDEIVISNDEIYELLDNFKISKAQYNNSAKILIGKITPDALINIFEKLKSSHADAEEAYLYLLFEFQMLDKVREITENSDASEYQNIKILMYLRENGKLVPENLLFR
ncbi:LapA family protein [Campylobacter sp. MOP51]|uniref:LapA family protein n=1 Tax=Campylobacter canis TaxID=3378588 RepID=UPI003C67C707